MVGMSRDQVLMAMGPPKYKPRETKDGLEIEDWVYGTAPGRITFVTFNGDKVIKVKDEYAGCRSWLELQRELPFEGTPVLADEEFDRAAEEIEAIAMGATPAYA